MTPNKQTVLRNSLAWCDIDLVPSQRAITLFFNHNERGCPLPAWDDPDRNVVVELIRGWRCYYGSPYAWIVKWEQGKGNLPIEPPAAWVADSLFGLIDSGWLGWYNILVGYIREGLNSPKFWERKRPCFEKAYEIASYLHNRK